MAGGIFLCLLGLACSSPSRPYIPEWIESNQVADSFEVAINAISESKSRTEIPTPDDFQITCSPNEYEAAFRGSSARDKFSVGLFRDAVSKFLPASTGCDYSLAYWFRRPGWFVPRSADISRARACAEALLVVLTEPGVFHGFVLPQARLLAEALPEMLFALYSVEADWVVSVESAIPTTHALTSVDWRKYAGMQTTISRSDMFSLMVNRAVSRSTGTSEISDLDSEAELMNSFFYTHMQRRNFRDPMMVHYTDFLDSIELVRHETYLNMFLFILMEPRPFDFDELDRRNLLSRDLAAHSAGVVQRKKLRMSRFFSDWITLGNINRIASRRFDITCLPWSNSFFASSVGAVIDARFSSRNFWIVEHDEVEVIATALLEIADYTGRAVVEYYKCILSKITEGKLVISDDPKHVLLVLRMVRAVSSATTFLVDELRSINTTS